MMTINYIALLQGAIAGGTTAYLHNRVHSETGEKKADTWTSVALQVNHLLYLIAARVHAMNIPLGALGTIARVAHVLTPCVWLTTLGRPTITQHEAACAQQLSRFYQVAVVATAIATGVLGNPVFAITSLTMLAIDAGVTGKTASVFAQVRKITASLALIGCGVQAFSGRSVTAYLAQIGTVVIMVKLFVLDLLTGNPSLAEEPCQTSSDSVDVPRPDPLLAHPPFVQQPNAQLFYPMEIPQVGTSPVHRPSLSVVVGETGIWS